MLAAPTVPVAAIVAVTSPCFTVLVRYCVAAAEVDRWVNHQNPLATATTTMTTAVPQRFTGAV